VEWIAWRDAMNSLIRAVTFDVGGTLLEPWPSVGHLYAEVATGFGIHSIAPAELDRRFAAAWRARRQFDYSRGAWKNVVTQSFAELTEALPDDACFDAIYQRFASASAWRVFDDVLPTLQQLKSRGFKLGIVSNWDERLRPLLAQLRLLEWFDAAVISHEIGHWKPAPQMFHRVAELLALPAKTVMHVGDSQQEDVLGAQAAGCGAVLLKRGEPADGAICGLAALLPTLESLSRESETN
jgi:putative hydrolase of the HAD superfamily